MNGDTPSIQGKDRLGKNIGEQKNTIREKHTKQIREISPADSGTKTDGCGKKTQIREQKH